MLAPRLPLTAGWQHAASKPGEQSTVSSGSVCGAGRARVQRTCTRTLIVLRWPCTTAHSMGVTPASSCTWPAGGRSSRCSCTRSGRPATRASSGELAAASALGVSRAMLRVVVMTGRALSVCTGRALRQGRKTTDVLGRSVHACGAPRIRAGGRAHVRMACACGPCSRSANWRIRERWEALPAHASRPTTVKPCGSGRGGRGVRERERRRQRGGDSTAAA